MVEKLIGQIRSFSDSPIHICVNGEYQEKFNEEYRKKMLNLCLSYESILPIFFVEMRGLSKMWNTLISFSESDNVLVLNDDIEVFSNDIFEKIENIKEETTLIKINGSFSHFIINRRVLDKVGWFDERLLGFGEEDGDITFRFLENGHKIYNLSVCGLVNLVSDTRQNIKPGIGKYSLYNREFTFNEKYTPTESGIVGMFGKPYERKLTDINNLPCESYYWDNKEKLSSK